MKLLIPVVSLQAVVALGLTLSAGRLPAADGAIAYEAQPGSQMKMDGTSTIHDWTVIGKIISGRFEVDPSFDTEQLPKTPKVQPKAEAKIPVRSLKSQVMMGSGTMDKVMQSHMKMTNFTMIEYKLIELTGKGTADAAKSMQYDAKGTLTVAGKTQTNTMPVTIERVDAKKLKISGITTVKMSDFDILPPNPNIAGVGIKTGDEVKLSFDWVVGKAQ